MPVRVEDMMTREVVSVRPETPVREIARLLLDQGLTGVPVIGAEGLIGIITDADLIVREADIQLPSYLQILDNFIILGDRKRFDEEVRRSIGTVAEQIMTREVVTVEPDATIGEVAKIMFERKVNPVPVVDQGRVVGIISRADIIRLIVREMDAP